MIKNNFELSGIAPAEGAASFYAGKQISKQAMKSFGDILSRTYAEAFGEVFAGLTIGVLANISSAGVKIYTNIDESINETVDDTSEPRDGCDTSPYPTCISNRSI